MLVLGTLGIVASLAAEQGGQSAKPTQAHRSTNDPPVPPKGKLGQDLFLAIDHHDAAAVDALLGKGADPNARNGLEFTPLAIAAASHQVDVMKALLKAGAEPDADSSYGSALTFAAATGNAVGANLLIALGVDVDIARTDGMTPLMMAANCGAADIVSDLLQHKASVNETDRNRTTALMFAARGGYLEAGKRLLGAGATLESADKLGRTALMEAAINGQAEFVDWLLANGAKVDTKDASGRSALVLASSYGDYPKVVRALLSRSSGDKPHAGAIASARGFAGAAKELGAKRSSAPVGDTRRAVATSLELLQASMSKFTQMTACVSCHQEGLGRIATGVARKAGLPIDEPTNQAQQQRIDGMLGALRPLHEQAVQSPEAMKQVPLIEINEVATIDGWMLAGMAEHGQPATAETAAVAKVLAAQQSPEGCWTFSMPRVPMQSSRFTFTALAVRSLNAYFPASESAERARRIDLARTWLTKTAPQTSEDRAFRLLGLKWAGAGQEEIGKAAREILADQRPDGGWSQLPHLQSDAYATGQALYALHEGSGMPSADPTYKKGVAYLLRTQDKDGSWYVAKRAIPANNYIDAGFPHGQSQYASFNGTCWATIALIESLKR